ncbi:MAG: deoxynucleoside kinase, partial [Planctomycetota bacterium]
HLRSFVLKGLCQLNPDLMHPVLKETIVELAQRLNGADFMINPDRPQLISIAGLIGAGKTTLTELLSKKLSCKTLLEPYDKNPFLSDVYAGKTELALDSQLFFLTERACQLNPEVLPAGKTVISDYLFEKELIYAKRLLDAKQLDCYQQKYRSVSPTVTKPMLVIYLTDSAQQCLERIHKRNRPYEQKIDLQFLRDLHYDYQQLFESWKKSPVIRMSMSDFDIKNSDSLDYLLSQIKSYITT